MVKYFECVCSSSEHTFKIHIEDKEAYLTIHLASLPLFKRIIFAIKYIFGYSCKYGHHEEVILDKAKCEELKDCLNEHICN